MIKLFLSVFLLTLPIISFAYPKRPNFKISPGKICTTKDPDFSTFRYDEQIPYCQRHVEWETKAEVLREYGVPLKNRKQYIIDHIIPLSIGGSNSIKNLWPEHLNVKRELGSIEDDVFLAVRDGLITQEEAIIRIMKAKFGENVYLDHLLN
jgi:hypothetical protein